MQSAAARHSPTCSATRATRSLASIFRRSRTPRSPPFVELGGDVSRVKTYGQLVTAIINPSHKLAEGYPEEVVSEDGDSKMPVYNEVMTVQELIDIVAFLQPQYNVVVPKYSYPMYY